MRRILFVDDEPKELVALKRLFGEVHPEWEVACAESAPAALALLTQSPFDMVVSDLSMPGMDGAELLTEIAKKYPHTIRLLLSGHTGHSAILRSVGPAHQYLSKPWEPEEFLDTLARAFALQDLLGNEKLKQLVTQIQFLPGVPALSLEMLRELRKEDPAVARLAQLISQDPAVCTKLLQIVNSAFFGLPQLISTPVEAILHLGVETVKNVVLSLQLYAAFNGMKMNNVSLDRLWNHGWKTGLLARGIAEAENFTTPDYAFVAGLLHDAGKLVLASGLPSQYTEVIAFARAQGQHVVEAERHLLGATHAEVGAYLLGLWGFPPAIVEAVALHHFPVVSHNGSFNLVTALHVANVLAHERADAPGSGPASEVNLEYLAALGLQARLGFWRSYIGKMPLKEAG